MAEIVVQFEGTVYENGYGQIAKKVMRDKSIHRQSSYFRRGVIVN